MSTWTSFHIKTKNLDNVIEKLKELASASEVTTGSYPSDFRDNLLDEDKEPNYLLVDNSNSEWVTVLHNSSNKLEDWCIDISEEFETKIIVTFAQSVSDYYYFALYDNGEKKREIEYCYSDDLEPTNFGDKFNFENDEPGKKVNYGGEESYLFDFDSMEEYCKHFGLILQSDNKNYTIIKGKKSWKLW
jgi:hypothetical protein